MKISALPKFFTRNDNLFILISLYQSAKIDQHILLFGNIQSQSTAVCNELLIGSTEVEQTVVCINSFNNNKDQTAAN
jgi:hypothetical protein